eukprot:gene14598-22325_t
MEWFPAALGKVHFERDWQWRAGGKLDGDYRRVGRHQASAGDLQGRRQLFESLGATASESMELASTAPKVMEQAILLANDEAALCLMCASDWTRLAALLRECTQAQGKLLGMLGSVSQAQSSENELDALLQNILTSSAIEGEQLNVGSVRSSLARRLGLEQLQDGSVSRRSEGLADLMLDATQQVAQPFTLT